MTYIIVTDIFGKTQALVNLCKNFSNTCIIVDPYKQKLMHFSNEEEAYVYFTSKVGLEKYTHILNQVLMQVQGEIKIFAFSMGASALWLLSQNRYKCTFIKTLCFYPSQIRHHLHINPKMHIEIIFPKREEHYNLSQIINKLKNKKNLTLFTSNYLHGFMNEHSRNFNKKECEKYQERYFSY